MGQMKKGDEAMSLGSIFAGIGGFDLAAKIAGLKIAWQIEKDLYCLKILEKNFPGVKKYGDVKDVKSEELEKVNIITAGLPCQPFSLAGNLRGRKDDRYLWPEVLYSWPHPHGTRQYVI
jgi:DNA (cytosine-5)-methyltransferase 1